MRDTLKVVWNLTSTEELERFVPKKSSIPLSFYCCQQFLISKQMVHRRPLSVWKSLLHMMNEQDVCHEGEPEFDHLYSYRYTYHSRNKDRIGPEPADISYDKEQPGNFHFISH